MNESAPGAEPGATPNNTDTQDSSRGSNIEPGHRRYLFLWRDAIKGWKDRKPKPSDLSPRARATALNLSTYMSTAWGTAAVGLRRLAYDRGTSPKTELRYLNDLREMQFLIWRSGRGPGRPTEYQARFPDGWFDAEPLRPGETLTQEEPLHSEETVREREPLHSEAQPLHMRHGTVSPRGPQNSHRKLQENSVRGGKPNPLLLEHRAGVHREGVKSWPNCQSCIEEARTDAS
jgi:hypothetical protein